MGWCVFGTDVNRVQNFVTEKSLRLSLVWQEVHSFIKEIGKAGQRLPTGPSRPETWAHEKCTKSCVQSSSQCGSLWVLISVSASSFQSPGGLVVCFDSPLLIISYVPGTDKFGIPTDQVLPFRRYSFRAERPFFSGL
jgi:hypothetical protein